MAEKHSNDQKIVRPLFLQEEYLYHQEPTCYHGFLVSDMVVMKQIGKIVEGKTEPILTRPVVGLLDRH